MSEDIPQTKEPVDSQSVLFSFFLVSWEQIEEPNLSSAQSAWLGALSRLLLQSDLLFSHPKIMVQPFFSLLFSFSNEFIFSPQHPAPTLLYCPRYLPGNLLSLLCLAFCFLWDDLSSLELFQQISPLEH